jgi:alkylation response protein AidB-like acyl-CoA dehydrogenase
VGIGALSVGIAQAGLEAALEYSQSRKQFGSHISDFQGIQWMLADMATQLEAARLLGLNASAKRGHGLRYTREATFAKLFASEMVDTVTDLALQIHGGYGYSREMPLERYVRDARIARIFDGSSEVHRNIIARMILAD